MVHNPPVILGAAGGYWAFVPTTPHEITPPAAHIQWAAPTGETPMVNAGTTRYTNTVFSHSDDGSGSPGSAGWSPPAYVPYPTSWNTSSRTPHAAPFPPPYPLPPWMSAPPPSVSPPAVVEHVAKGAVRAAGAQLRACLSDLERALATESDDQQHDIPDLSSRSETQTPLMAHELPMSHKIRRSEQTISKMTQVKANGGDVRHSADSFGSSMRKSMARASRDEGGSPTGLMQRLEQVKSPMPRYGSESTTQRAAAARRQGLPAPPAPRLAHVPPRFGNPSSQARSGQPRRRLAGRAKEMRHWLTNPRMGVLEDAIEVD